MKRFDRLVRGALFSLAALAFAEPARALIPVTLGFEDLDPGYATTGPLLEYGGFTWTGARYIAHPSVGSKPGVTYWTGTIGAVAAYVPVDGIAPGSLTLRRTDGSHFDFTSAFLTTAAGQWSESLWVEARRDGIVVDSRLVEIYCWNPPEVTAFGFVDVDEVWISPYGDDFTVDDVAVAVAPPPADTVPPTIEILPVPPVVSQDALYLSVRACDPDHTYEPLSGAIVVGAVRQPFTMDNCVPVGISVQLAEGPNPIVIEVTDEAGNVARRMLPVTRDTVAPVVEIVVPASGAIIRALEFPVSVRVEDATAVTLVLDHWKTVPVVNGIGTTTMSLYQTQGPQWIVAEAIDAAGNRTDAVVEVIADVRDFGVSVDVASGTAFGPLPGDLLPVRITVEGPSPARVEVSTGGAYEVPGGGGVIDVTVPLAEGANAFTVTATTIPYGEVATAPVLVTYDTRPPAAAFQSPVRSAFVRGTVEVVLDATDASTAVSGVAFTVDGGTGIPSAGSAPWSASIDLSAVADGPHVISAVVADAVGNVATPSVGVVVDATAPRVVLVSPAAGGYVRGVITVVAEASDATSGIKALRLFANGAPLGGCEDATRCEATLDTTALPNAALALSAVAIDLAGNEESVQAVVAVDDAAPSKFLIAPAEGQIVAGTVEVVFAVDDPGFAGAECAVGGTSVGVATEPAFRRMIDVTQFPDGPLEVACTSADLAGNRATERVTVTVRNWKLTLDPRVLSTKADPGCSSVVTLYVEGKSVALLVPTSAHALALAVPGGATTPLVVRAAGEQVGDADGDGTPDLTLKFDRAALLSAIRGALAAGAIAPGTPVPVRLLDGQRTLGVTAIELR